MKTWVVATGMVLASSQIPSMSCSLVASPRRANSSLTRGRLRRRAMGEDYSTACDSRPSHCFNAAVPRLLVAVLLSALAAGVGCGDSDPDLIVELKTDFVAGGDFTRIRTTLVPTGSAGSGREADQTASFGDGFAAGRRIAEFEGVQRGVYLVRVQLSGPDGLPIIERTVRVNVSESTGVTVLITRSCRSVVCPGTGDSGDLTECLSGVCVPPDCRPGAPNSCGEGVCGDDLGCEASAPCARAVCDEGTCFATLVNGACGPTEWCDPDVGCRPRGAGSPDGGVPDAGSCMVNADCNDAVDCTIDVCAGGACQYTADDAGCTEASDGICIEGFGCQYSGCTPSTCIAGDCEVARCEGDTCVLESACDTAEMCCGGACVAAGCDDDNPCTDDACGAAGCTNTPNTEACDDGVFCNGPDTCSGGTCAQSAGDPCPGMTVCEESSSTCTGCGGDGDCPADIPRGFGSCGGFSGTCDLTGTRSQTVTSFTCVSGTCMGSDRMETEACGRVTEGLSCGITSFGGWGSCGGYSGTCDESGTRSRSQTDLVCMGGMCATVMGTDMGPCSRNTDGGGCGTVTMTGWGSCGGFGSTCDESGTQSRTVTTPTCVSEACVDQNTMENQGCSRNTDGTVCMSPSVPAWGACTGFSSTCDETGSQSRTRTDFTCMTGSCSGTMMLESQSCTRNTEGNVCEDFASCIIGNCNNGSCSGGGGCGAGQVCCEPPICVTPPANCP